MIDLAVATKQPIRVEAAPTKEDRVELLRWAFLDYRRFAGLLDIVPKSGPRIKLGFNSAQKRYDADRTWRDLILKARQMGFTTEEQARDIWHFLTYPGARVTMMCQSISDADSPARILARNYDVMFQSLAQLGLKLEFGRASGGVWELPKRDAVLRIVEAGATKRTAQKKGRGATVTRLHTTESAFWEYAGETLLATEESVSEEPWTEIVHESTPNGAFGKFHGDCVAAIACENDYHFHFMPWYLDLRYRRALEPDEVIEPETERERQLAAVGVSSEQLKWYRRKVAQRRSQELVDQEFPSDPQSCFLLAGRLFFNAPIIDLLYTRRRPPIEVRDVTATGQGVRAQFRILRKPKPGQQYIAGVDTSEGVGGSASAVIVYERGTGEHVATLQGQLQPHDLARAAAEIGYFYNRATLVVERNNHGHAVLLALLRIQRYPAVWCDHDGRPGWINAEHVRTAALDHLEHDHRLQQWATTDELLIGELRRFIVTKKGRAEGAGTDDLVLAAAIGWDVIRKPMTLRNYANLPPA